MQNAIQCVDINYYICKAAKNERCKLKVMWHKIMKFTLLQTIKLKVKDYLISMFICIFFVGEFTITFIVIFRRSMKII